MCMKLLLFQYNLIPENSGKIGSASYTWVRLLRVNTVCVFICGCARGREQLSSGTNSSAAGDAGDTALTARLEALQLDGAAAALRGAAADPAALLAAEKLRVLELEKTVENLTRVSGVQLKALYRWLIGNGSGCLSRLKT